jgi:osmotically-inducible protein OsmY
MTTFKRRYSGPALAALLLAASGLAARDVAEGLQQRPTGSAITAPASGPTDDSTITAGIHRRWAADSTLQALTLQVETRGGRVLLRGAAPDTASRRHAGELASTVPGVLALHNDISVQLLPPGRDTR